MSVPNHVLLSELNQSLAQMNKIIKSRFHRNRDPVYVAKIRSESVFLKATIKAVKADNVRNMKGEWRIWARWFILREEAMQTIYSRETLIDGTFHAYCAGMRQERDYELSRLNERT